MGKSLEQVLERRDKKVLLEAMDLVRGQAITVPWSLDTIDDLNELIATDGYKISIVSDGSDRDVVLLKNGEPLGQRKVYVVGDEVFAD